MKIKDLLEGNVTNIADARSKRAMDRDAEAMREIDQMLAADPEVFAIQSVKVESGCFLHFPPCT